jgi:UDP-3-O-[3-hydroxymyristoyl] glucosamine N-acyltransferase
MAQEASGWTLGELAKLLQGTLTGPADLFISRPVPSDSSDPQGITFAENDEYLAAAEHSAVAAIIVGKDCGSCRKPTIVVEDARASFGRLLAMMIRPLPLASGIHSQAVVAEGARVDPLASVGPFCVIENGATVASGAKVYPFCYVGENCSVGEGSILYPHVILYQDVTVGARCVIHSGVVLGADGFGFFWDGTRQAKVPQVGDVRLADEVEIGANAAIDRATAGTTEIGKGTKIDNLVQIGHNSVVGSNTVIAGQTGVSGSSHIGDRVTIGGQAALSHHVRVCDDAVLGGRTGVTEDITEPGEYFGLPARPKAEALRSALLAGRLPDLFARIRELERRVETLEGPSD